MREIILYKLEELCNENKEILIITQEGVELHILVEDGKTFVKLPFGNKTKKPRKYGHLSTGIVILPIY